MDSFRVARLPVLAMIDMQSAANMQLADGRIQKQRARLRLVLTGMAWLYVFALCSEHMDICRMQPWWARLGHHIQCRPGGKRGSIGLLSDPGSQAPSWNYWLLSPLIGQASPMDGRSYTTVCLSWKTCQVVPGTAAPARQRPQLRLLQGKDKKEASSWRDLNELLSRSESS